MSRELHPVLHEARRYCYKIYYKIYFGVYHVKHFFCGALTKRAEKASGKYGFGFQITDTFIGIRYKGKDYEVTGYKYGLIGISIDSGWYDPVVSYGVVWRGHWHGLFIKY